MSGELILIVEDEVKMARVVAEYLQAAGCRTHHLTDGQAAVSWARSHDPSAILLDVMLPGCDGFTVCRRIRAASKVPIIVLTARASERDRLNGFELGADDYVCKPFSPKELVARTRAVLRRVSSPARPDARHGLLLDRLRYTVSANGHDVPLTALEFELLSVLIALPGRIFSRDELMDRVYRDYRTVNDRTIDSHVKKLRRKLDRLELAAQPIRSVYGAGYKLVLS
jgi:two-component system, OmpR family, response regulator BaeR